MTDAVGTGSPPPEAAAAAAPVGDLTEALVETCRWSDAAIHAAGIPIVDVPLVSIGGGLGSFALVDMLRIAGVGTDRVAVLTTLDLPHETYRYLAENSQIQDGDRLRSDSMSCIDNIWGFPSYALREAWTEHSLRPLWSVLTEPLLAEFFNPRAGHVYSGVAREARRIGWAQMLRKGQARMVRPREGGGYFSILTPPRGASRTRRVAYRSDHVHIAVGYPSLRFLPDLQEYRTRYDDYHRVVNAYEPHLHVYQGLRASPGTVVVRGAGIVASRILERLIDDRDREGARTQIVHLFRTYVAGSRGPRTARRRGGHGFTYQPFTFPKAAGGGQLRQRTLRLEGRDRADFIRSIGGTTTAKRSHWERQLERGRREGWYRAVVGEVAEVVPDADGRVVSRVRSRDGRITEVAADYVIDATGLEGDIRDHRLLADLLRCSGAGVNPYGRLEVDRHFEVRGTANAGGRIYASGSITLGGYLAPVDSFWGLQHAALEIVDQLAAHGFCTRPGSARSIAQWWRWMRNRPL